ncbi:hypothetical protein GCM10022236_46450 [Microlunatus ginsengisoli]|uniref:Zinc-ribbon domain-containing protein n=1 Tax=Microlunatus ginsengisoli TaxID=363863 RepID=A0ABP7AR48_9ACTN
MASGDVICEDCGETNKPGTEFCIACGAYLGWQAQPASPSANEVTQPMQAAPAARSAAPAAAAATGSAPTTSPPARTPAGPPARPAAPPRQPLPGPGIQPAPPQQQSPAAGYPAADATVAAPVEAAATGCPSCGRTVEPGRRFCGHCGHQLIMPGGAAVPAARQPTKRDTWWSRLWDSKDRAARRAFRRNLPPLYRWRRLVIIVLSLALVAGGLTLLRHSPKSLVMSGYYNIKKTVVQVQPVNARTIPAGQSAGGTDPSALVDNTKGAWLMTWNAQTKGTPCGTPPTTPVIELWFDPIRVRRLDVWPGLAKEDPSRLLQYRPKQIWVAYGDHCQSFPIANVESVQLPLDTKVPVGSIRIGVESAWPPDQTPGQDVLGFSEIRVQARPRT